MPNIPGHLPASKGLTSEAFRRLPDAVVLEDTVESVRNTVPLEPAGERNAFIDAALQAGG
jgi:hypothetical protein